MIGIGLGLGINQAIMLIIKSGEKTTSFDIQEGSKVHVDDQGNVIIDMATSEESQSHATAITARPGSKPEKITLAEAIRVFNARAANDPIGKNQPPLTQDEVIAAITWALLNPEKLPVSDETLEALKNITGSRDFRQNMS